jgi:hypothetical protein
VRFAARISFPRRSDTTVSRFNKDDGSGAKRAGKQVIDICDRVSLFFPSHGLERATDSFGFSHSATHRFLWSADSDSVGGQHGRGRRQKHWQEVSGEISIP